MTESNARMADLAPGPPTAGRVLGRVWFGGVLWGPAGGLLLGALYASVPVVDGVSSEGSFWGDDTRDEVTTLLVLAVSAGPLLGLLVGFVTGLVAGLLLLACRPLGRPAPGVASAGSLGLLALAGGTWVEWQPPFVTLFVLPLSVIAAWPLWRTLHRALRPEPTA